MEMKAEARRSHLQPQDAWSPELEEAESVSEPSPHLNLRLHPVLVLLQ